MTCTVYCIKLKREAEALLTPPIPGPKGQWVVENISQQAWTEWQLHQTRLINEKQLNLLDPKIRKYLMSQMDNYFSGHDVDQADGYVPEDK